jgi:glycosyltransferase involved in cell wall biosynthesis
LEGCSDHWIEGKIMDHYNVLHLAYLTGIGGIQVRLIELLSQPVPHFKFFVFSLQPISPIWQDKLKSLGIPFGWASRKSTRDNELLQYAKKCDIHIAHFHTPWPQAKHELKNIGVNVIIEHDHGKIWYQPQAAELYNINSNLVDGVIALSAASREMLIQRLGYDSRKIRIIHNGIDFKNLTPTFPIPRPLGKKVVTTICRLVAIKGVDSLIQAVPRVLAEQKNVEFWIIGDGPVRRELEQLAVDLKVENNVKFWGEQRLIENFLVSTDLFVLSSVREPFGNVLAEAGYFGIPAIATLTDGIPEIIQNEVTGILLEPTLPFRNPGEADDTMAVYVIDGISHQLRKPLKLDPNVLSAAIVRLLNHPSLSRKLGKAAKKRVTQRFNIKRYRKEIIDYYLEKLAEKKK